MHKLVVAVLLVVCNLRLGAADESQNCTQLVKMVECFEDIRKYMDRPVNLTVVMNAAGGDQNVAKRCQQFNTFLECLNKKMEGCQVVTDAQDQSIVFWNNAKRGVSYMCTEQREAFVKYQPCLSSEVARRAVIACDSADESTSYNSRRKRHTCDDYNREIQCADQALTRKCGSEAARHVGHLARIFLKNTVHTKDCAAPEFKVTSGAAIGGIHLPLLLSTCLATVKLLL